jgi:hypothetical protein
MAKATKAATLAHDNTDNAGVDFAAECKAIVHDLAQATMHGDKEEASLASASFRLAYILRMDALPSDNTFAVMRLHSPDRFFSSEDVRKIWYDKSVCKVLLGEEAMETYRSKWNRLVDAAFTVWACADFFKRNAEGPQVDFNRRTVPVAAFLRSNEQWTKLHNNTSGQLGIIGFGRSVAYAYGHDGSKKGKAAAVMVKFRPSLAAFMGERAAWLTVKETRKTRGAKDGAPAATSVPTGAAADQLNKLFTAGDGNKPAPVKLSEDDASALDQALHAILANLAVNNAAKLSGLLLDMMRDDTAGASFRGVLSASLSAFQREATRESATAEKVA